MERRKLSKKVVKFEGKAVLQPLELLQLPSMAVICFPTASADRFAEASHKSLRELLI